MSRTATSHTIASRRSLRPLAGFTLIELVLAMSIAAVLAVSLFAAMRVAFRAQRSAEQAVAPVSAVDAALAFVALDLQNIRPASVDDWLSGVDGKDDRGHDGDSLTFFTTAPAADQPAANGEVKRVELAVSVDNNGQHRLVRRVIRNLFTDVLPAPDEETLCIGVYSLNLRYYDGSDWQNTWDSTQLGDVLPKAIEVTLQLDSPGGSADMPVTAMRVVPLSAYVEPTDATGGGL